MCRASLKAGPWRPGFVLSALLLLSVSAHAGSICLGTNWAAAGSGAWSLNTNWSPATTPNGGADVCLANGSNAITTLDGSYTVGNLTVGSANRLDILGGNSLFFQGTVFNAGTVNVNAGNLIGSGSYVQTGGATNIAGPASLIVGSYSQSGGTTAVNGLLSASNGFNVTGGTFLGTGTVVLPAGSFSTIGSGATLLPGTSASSPGAINFNGSLELQSGSILSEGITGTAVGQFGLTAITGGANVLQIDSGAILNLSASDGVRNGSTVIPVGSQITIVTARLLAGSFSASQLTGDVSFNNGLESWTIFNQGNSEVLRATNTGPITATFSGPSASWTALSAIGTPYWSCSPAILANCIPNSTPVTPYNAVINAPGQQLTLDSATTVNVNSLTLTAGALNISGTLNLTNQPNGITDINANSSLTLNGTFNTGVPGSAASALAQLTSVEGTLTLANGQALTVTPQGGTLLVNGGTLNGGAFGMTVAGNLTETGNAAVNGPLTIAGSLAIGPSASVSGAVTAGQVVNNGNAGAGIVSLGTFLNNGQAQDVTSNGLLTNGATGQLISVGGITASGGLNNQGLIQLTGGMPALFVTGDFHNQAGASLQVNSVVSGSVVTGNLYNDGAITYSSTLSAGSYINVLGAIQNTGTLTLVANPAVNGRGNAMFGASFTNTGSVTLGQWAGPANATSLNITGSYTQTGTGSTEVDAGAVLNAGSYTQSGAGSATTIMGPMAPGLVTPAIGPATLNTGSYSQSAGITTVNGILNATSINITGGTLAGTGTVNASSAAIGSGATLLPGASPSSPGTLAFGGSLELQSGSVLSEGIVGMGTGQYGVTAVTGVPAILQIDPGAVLNISASAGIRNGSTAVPVGSQLTILTSGALTGGYTNAQLTGDVSFNNGLESWAVSSQGNNQVLLATAAAPITATWNGPLHDWTDNFDPAANTGNTNWTCSLTVLGGCIPNNSAAASYNAIINAPGQKISLGGTNVNLNTLTLAAGALTIEYGAALNLTNQPGGFTDINANSALTVNGTFTTSGLSPGSSVPALAQLTTIEGSLSLGNAQGLTITPIGGTLLVNGGSLTASALNVVGNFTETGNAVVNGLTVSGTLTVGPSAILSGFATAGQVVNNSTAAPLVGVVSLGTFLNNGLAQDITSNGLLTNSATGQLTSLFGVSALSGLDNQGLIHVISGAGAFNTVTGDFQNQRGGSVQINGIGGLLQISGNLYNDGSFVFSPVVLSPSSVMTSGNNFMNVQGAIDNTGTLTITSTPRSVSGVPGNFISVATFNNSGALSIGPENTVAVAGNYTQSGTGATTEVDVGASLTAAQININGGTLGGLGIVSGSTTVAPGAVLAPAYVAGSSSPLTLDSLTLNGTLQEAIGSGGFGVTAVNGALVLNSATSILNIVQSSNYNPALGTVLEIATAGSISGTFGSIANNFFNGGTEKWNVSYSNGEIDLVAFAAVPSSETATWSSGNANWKAGGAFSCFPSLASCSPDNVGGMDYRVILNSPNHSLTLGTPPAPDSVTLDSVVQLSGDVDIVGGSTLSAGSYVASGGAVDLDGALDAGSITIGNGVTVDGTGSMTGAVTDAGKLAPGVGLVPGALSVNGSLTMTSTADFEELIIDPNTFGELFVNSALALDGNLDILLEDTLDLPIGTSFQIIEAASYSGLFSSVDLNGSNSLLFNGGTEQFQVIYDANGVELRVATPGSQGDPPAPEPGTLVLVALALAVCGIEVCGRSFHRHYAARSRHPEAHQ